MNTTRPTVQLDGVSLLGDVDDAPAYVWRLFSPPPPFVVPGSGTVSQLDGWPGTPKNLTDDDLADLGDGWRGWQVTGRVWFTSGGYPAGDETTNIVFKFRLYAGRWHWYWGLDGTHAAVIYTSGDQLAPLAGTLSGGGNTPSGSVVKL